MPAQKSAHENMKKSDTAFMQVPLEMLSDFG